MSLMPEQMMLPAGTLQGKVAVVTGGATGMGKAMAQEFARLGAQVVITSRKQEMVEQAAAEILIEGGQALGIVCDVRHPEQIEAMLNQTEESYGMVDIMVNNAAGNFIVPSEELSPNGWRTVIDIVLNGTFYCSQAAAKRWIQSARPGVILNMIASYAWTGSPGVVHSASAKAGVLAMTRTLAAEWGRHGIRTNAIAPGPIERTGGADRLFSDAAFADLLINHNPMRRLGTPEEIAQLASYMVSPYASYLNGEIITLDGGEWLNPGFLRALK